MKEKEELKEKKDVEKKEKAVKKEEKTSKKETKKNTKKEEKATTKKTENKSKEENKKKSDLPKSKKKESKKEPKKTKEQIKEELFSPAEEEKPKPKEKEETKQESKFKQVKKVETKDYDKYEKEEPKDIKSKVLIGVALVAIILIFSSMFAIINLGNKNILDGISVKGIDISGLSKEDATTKVNAVYEKRLAEEIKLKYQDYETTIDSSVIEAHYDIEKAINEAQETGRKGNIFINNFEILKTMIFKKDINIDMTLNEDMANQTIEDIGSKLPGIVVESSYYIEEDDDELIVGKGKDGIGIDKEKLLNQVKDYLNEPVKENEQKEMEIPVLDKTPEPIDIEKIHSEVYKEVQDAYYTKDPFEIHPEVEGVDFDVEKAKEILAEEGKEEYIIPLIITKPKVTLDQIGTKAFPDRLATFTTKYDASNTDRTTNLRLACQKLNGKVVLPGDTFSYNKTLGERTVAAGYRNGKIYENGEVVDGIGGGICQISSTLYNTVLMANLDVVERRNHQFVPSYLPAGRDATVVYGATDFKFKNTRKYPVRITASVSNGIATVSMYGIKEEEEYTISFSTRTISTVPPSTKYQDDPSLPAGQEKVKQNGANGLVTETYITKSLNGKVVSSKLLSRDTYSAMQKIILRGTGAASATPAAPAEQTPAPTTPSAPSTETEKPTDPDPDPDPATNTTTE